MKRYFDNTGLPRCPKHREYKAVRFPGTGCLHCILKWDAVYGTDYVTTMVVHGDFGSAKQEAARVSAKFGGLTYDQIESKPSTKKTKVKQPKPTGKLKNKIAILLDRSSSMYSLARDAERKLKEVIKTIASEAKSNDQETTVTFATFADNNTFHFFDLPVDEAVGYIRNFRYAPGGMTALYSSVDETIKKFQQLDTGDIATSFLVITITDGQENASYKVSADRLRRDINKCQMTDRWTFAFQLPTGGYKLDFCARLGVPEGNVMEWEISSTGLYKASTATQVGLSNYYSSRSVGATNSTSFYTTDLSKVKTKDLKAKLVDIKDKANVWTVDTYGEQIRNFCERKSNRTYQQGKAFYQLTKKEIKVQDYKDLLIMEKGKKSIYSGDAARQLLGLPATGTVKIVPGNHSNFDVFIQSTSFNRKLVRGTKVIYLK